MYVKGLVSIVVPVYRVEAYLPRCINSLLEQTYRNLEIILIDDGSPDNCPEMCDCYAMQDARIKVIHQKNGGLANARNVGLAAATGEYLAYVDSDDWVDKLYVEKLVNLLKLNDADMATCHELWTDDANAIIHHSKEQAKIYNTQQALEAMLYQRDYDVSAHGKLYKTRICKPHPYPTGMLFEDLGTTYKIVANCKRVVCSNQQYYYYFQSPNSIVRSGFNCRKLDAISLVDEVYDFIITKFPDLEKAACCRKFGVYCYILRQLPDDSEWDALRSKLWQFIQSNRFEVIIDGKARLKNRIAGICSCFGLHVLVKI